MDKRITILEGIYGGGGEEGRLTRTGVLDAALIVAEGLMLGEELR